MRKEIIFLFLFFNVFSQFVIAQTTFGDDQKSGLSKIPERKLTILMIIFLRIKDEL